MRDITSRKCFCITIINEYRIVSDTSRKYFYEKISRYLIEHTYKISGLFLEIAKIDNDFITNPDTFLYISDYFSC